MTKVWILKENKKWNKKHEEKMRDGEKRTKKGEKKMEKYTERKQRCIEVENGMEDKGNTMREGKVHGKIKRKNKNKHRKDEK